jgi:hypothetical protein
MNKYEATTKLRQLILGRGADGGLILKLQQWWCLPDDGSTTGHLNEAVGEWRDIPIEQ